VPTMPAEIMLLPPPFFLFNIYEVSYWSRCVIVPLLIIMDRKPICLPERMLMNSRAKNIRVRYTRPCRTQTVSPAI